MEINERKVETREDVMELIKKGIDVVSYITSEKDIDLVSTAIAIKGNEDDPFYEESAEMIIKAIIYYVINTDEDKTLARCKEIARVGYDNEDGVQKLKEILGKEMHSNQLYVFMDIATERSQKLIMEKLKERLENI